MIEHPSKNYCFYNIKKIEDIYKWLELTNGYYRTPKYEAVFRMINWLNNYKKKENLYIKGLNDYNNLRKLEILKKLI